MSVHVTSTIKINQLNINKLGANASKALSQTAKAVLTDIRNAKVMPFDTGTMQGDSTYVDDSKADSGTVSIVTSTPYARRLYYHPEYNFQRTHNSAAGGRWLRFWLPGGTRQDFAQKTFVVFYRRLNG